MKPLALLLFLLTTTNPGCRLPSDPSPSRAHDTVPFAVSVAVDDTAATFNVTGNGWIQILVNADMDTTGYLGYDFETCTVLDVRASDGAFAIRRTEPSESPAGWGPITGWATMWALSDRERAIRLPLAALGGTHRFSWRACKEDGLYYVQLDGVAEGGLASR